MKRILFMAFLTIFNLAVFAQICPAVNQVYKIDAAGNVIPTAPEGWMVAYAQDHSKPPSTFWWAAWAQKRIDPRDEKRVLCIYGLSSTNWWQIETVNQVPKSQVSSHSEWKRFGNDEDDYYRCERASPEACPFG